MYVSVSLFYVYLCVIVNPSMIPICLACLLRLQPCRPFSKQPLYAFVQFEVYMFEVYGSEWARSPAHANRSIGERNPTESTALLAPLMELRTCDRDCALMHAQPATSHALNPALTLSKV